MENAVDALAHCLALGEIGKVRHLESLIRAEIRRRRDVGEQQVRIDRRQELPQSRSDSARSSRHQDARHV